ncbi:hypothetical protein Sjap_008320 [Stephania japonica]|uniref:Uncharacterized protein n=1 Tax=Stephania japonica TaxID=461633 RepID=A0AAP0PEC5_9MAGN
MIGSYLLNSHHFLASVVVVVPYTAGVTGAISISAQGTTAISGLTTVVVGSVVMVITSGVFSS